MAKNIERMDADQLTAEIVRLSNEREALREQQKAASDRRDVLLTEQSQRERLTAAGFSPDQIDAVVSVGVLNAGSSTQGVK